MRGWSSLNRLNLQLIIAFTYRQNGLLVGCKYRTIEKRFWQVHLLLVPLKVSNWEHQHLVMTVLHLCFSFCFFAYHVMSFFGLKNIHMILLCSIWCWIGSWIFNLLSHKFFVGLVEGLAKDIVTIHSIFIC